MNRNDLIAKQLAHAFVIAKKNGFKTIVKTIDGIDTGAIVPKFENYVSLSTMNGMVNNAFIVNNNN